VRRREILAMLAGAAIMRPPVVIAQSNRQMRRIGVLVALAENDPGWRRNFAGFLAGLKDAGWVEGQNCQFESRYVPGGSESEPFRPAARELVALTPDVILAVPGSTAGLAAMRETRTIPIVFLQSVDPIREGLVTNIAHPAGNATGFTQSEPSLAGKWLQLLKEIAPNVTRAAIVFGPAIAMTATDPMPRSRVYARSFDEAARSIAVTVSHVFVHDNDEIASVIAGFAQQPNGGLIIPPDSFIAAHRVPLIAAAARHNLPAIYPYRYYAADGGLLSYGIDQPDLFRQAGGYVDRILRGAKAADLPVQTPKKFELVINFRTAKTLGLTILPALLARADEVIE
jgi:ABC-type uncharacterized transport system substrate-binding protein